LLFMKLMYLLKTAGRWKRYKSFRRKSFFASTFQRKLR